MDRLDQDIESKSLDLLQELLFNSWIHSEPDPDYRIALSSIVHAFWPRAGKEIKPSYFPLPSLCGYALGKITPSTTTVNAAWVLLFIASYLLDKIEDEETYHPIFKKFSPGAVTNLTTGLILHSARILAELEPDHMICAETLTTIQREFHRQALEVCAGQHQDLTLKEPTFDQIWLTVDAKSGKFFALGAYLGARLATANAEQVAMVSEIGRRIGILNQINNDVSGLGGEQDTSSDLVSGKATLPIQYALLVLPPEKRAILVEYLRNAARDINAEIEARKMIVSAGAIIYLTLEAAKHRQKAVQLVEQLQLPSERAEPLHKLINYTIFRSH